MNSKEFSLKIESVVKMKRVSYMDAIIDYCNLNDIDVGTVKAMVNKIWIKSVLRETFVKETLLEPLLVKSLYRVNDFFRT